MQKSISALRAALNAAARTGDDVAWLSSGRAIQPAHVKRTAAIRPLKTADDDVHWLDSKPTQARPSRRIAAVSRLGAVIGAGCLLTGLFPEVARAPIGVAYAAVDPILLDHALPGVISPAEIESFTQLTLRRMSEPEASASLEPVEIPDEILRFGAREVPRRLVATILKAALATDVDPVYLMALADKESGFASAVKASTSSAEGLFQFIDSTWLETLRAFGAKHGLGDEAAAIEMVEGRASIADARLRARVLDLRRDPYVAALMAAEMLKRDRADIAFRVGRDLTRTELYLAHFLGPQDATRFIAMRGKAQKQSAAHVFRAAARANRAIFFARKGRRSTGLAIADVYGRLDQMIDSRAARFQNVMAFAADARL